MTFLKGFDNHGLTMVVIYQIPSLSSTLWRRYDDVDIVDVAALVYTIYPIDAGAAFVTPATPAFSHHYDTGFRKTFVARYLQVPMIQVLSPL